MKGAKNQRWTALGALVLLAGAPTLAQGAAPVIAVRLVMTDAQGTPVMKTDLNGNILARYDYRPYGTQQSGPVEAGPGYTGHVNDPQTGLVYMQQRYYDPDVGRFLSVDPVGFAKKFSRYTYASNNPITNIDPDGMSDIPFGDCSKNPNCSYSFISGSDGGVEPSAVSKSSGRVPSGTPENMRKYFFGITASDRIKAAMAVADYYGIDRVGVNINYNVQLDARAWLLKDGPNGDGQLTIGPNLFNNSFGLMGAVLFHELGAHWKLQWMSPGTPSFDKQSVYMREVQAYRLELSGSSQRRFGLTHDEVESERTMLNRNYNALSPGNKKMVDQGIYKQL